MTKDRSKRIPLPPQKLLLETFRYDADTGLVWWRQPKGSRKLDKSCGTVGGSGYLMVRVDGRLYTLHRIIWKMITGNEPMHLDHINGCRIDNRITNIREVTRSQNNQSIGLTRANKSGYVGVRYSTKDRSWTSYIKSGSKRIHIGNFKEKKLAVESYNKKAIELHGEFAMRKVQHNIFMLAKEFGSENDGN
ncbi:hypothetical protein AI28_08025 [bacteria symbiont BFo1 of Frankliniella occidentalis]|nr:hypothetical protein AI28_08025 [bacteria symbiont BFo1 of Frankliniella occidentalis]